MLRSLKIVNSHKEPRSKEEYMEGKTTFFFVRVQESLEYSLTMTGKANIIILIHATLCTDTFQATI